MTKKKIVKKKENKEQTYTVSGTLNDITFTGVSWFGNDVKFCDKVFTGIHKFVTIRNNEIVLHTSKPILSTRYDTLLEDVHISFNNPYITIEGSEISFMLMRSVTDISTVDEQTILSSLKKASFWSINWYCDIDPWTIVELKGRKPYKEIFSNYNIRGDTK